MGCIYGEVHDVTNTYSVQTCFCKYCYKQQYKLFQVKIILFTIPRIFSLCLSMKCNSSVEGWNYNSYVGWLSYVVKTPHSTLLVSCLTCNTCNISLTEITAIFTRLYFSCLGGILTQTNTRIKTAMKNVCMFFEGQARTEAWVAGVVQASTWRLHRVTHNDYLTLHICLPSCMEQFLFLESFDDIRGTIHNIIWLILIGFYYMFTVILEFWRFYCQCLTTKIYPTTDTITKSPYLSVFFFRIDEATLLSCPPSSPLPHPPSRRHGQPSRGEPGGVGGDVLRGFKQEDPSRRSPHCRDS